MGQFKKIDKLERRAFEMTRLIGKFNRLTSSSNHENRVSIFRVEKRNRKLMKQDPVYAKLTEIENHKAFYADKAVGPENTDSQRCSLQSWASIQKGRIESRTMTQKQYSHLFDFEPEELAREVLQEFEGSSYRIRVL